MYATGRGVPEDDEDEAEAMRWFRLAAEQGHASAQVGVGIGYFTGRGVPQDEAEAVRWFRLAADQGDATAQFSLGVAHRDGKGVAQNSSAAYMWFSFSVLGAADEERDRWVTARDGVAGELTADQLAEADRRVREWQAAHSREP